MVKKRIGPEDHIKVKQITLQNSERKKSSRQFNLEERMSNSKKVVYNPIQKREL